MPALTITARAIRPRRTLGTSCSWDGLLLETPRVGNRMLLFLPSNGKWLVTGRIDRVMRGSVPNILYVSADGRVYQLVVHPV